MVTLDQLYPAVRPGCGTYQELLPDLYLECLPSYRSSIADLPYFVNDHVNDTCFQLPLTSCPSFPSATMGPCRETFTTRLEDVSEHASKMLQKI